MTDVDFLEVAVDVAARPERVFLYFTEPARHMQWMGKSAILDPVPGGIYRVRLRDGVEALGEFVEVNSPHQISFTWWTRGSAVAPGHSRVVVTFEPYGRVTRVVLRHHDLPDVERALQRERWRTCLGRLAIRARLGAS